ncbi:hypothetical protein [Phenylobacterium sp.]|jgi:hypothetical protein|uniref:hypothetical protein n=1 Tax=Phenylobacterium sp. TaxID=1871053 RepID=UPI002E30D734|nr:hypothetical protein [Phenylobacterium sp.]HEX2560142.1 hypothetical protein [Phenylobacterium sp.]
MTAATHVVHYIVSRSRQGWAVNVDADLLSEHVRLEEAQAQARMLTEQARAAGVDARLVDLSQDRPAA